MKLEELLALPDEEFLASEDIASICYEQSLVEMLPEGTDTAAIVRSTANSSRLANMEQALVNVRYGFVLSEILGSFSKEQREMIEIHVAASMRQALTELVETMVQHGKEELAKRL